MTGHARLVWRGIAIALAAIVVACTPPRLPAPRNLEISTRIKVRRVRDRQCRSTSTCSDRSSPRSHPWTSRLRRRARVRCRPSSRGLRGRARRPASPEGFDLCDSTHCQLYDPKRIQTSRFAAAARRGRAHARRDSRLRHRPAERLSRRLRRLHGGRRWSGVARVAMPSRATRRRAERHASRVAVSVSADRARAALNADATSAVGDDSTPSASSNAIAADAPKRSSSAARRPMCFAASAPRDLNRTLGDRALQSTPSRSRQRDAFVFDGTGFGTASDSVRWARWRGADRRAVDSILGTTSRARGDESAVA